MSRAASQALGTIRPTYSIIRRLATMASAARAMLMESGSSSSRAR